jgi:hypothetical protein
VLLSEEKATDIYL